MSKFGLSNTTTIYICCVESRIETCTGRSGDRTALGILSSGYNKNVPNELVKGFLEFFTFKG